jgi:hypothetical protein
MDAPEIPRRLGTAYEALAATLNEANDTALHRDDRCLANEAQGSCHRRFTVCTRKSFSVYVASAARECVWPATK